MRFPNIDVLPADQPRDLGLTLAGGGNRSFYQQALLEAWGERLWSRVAAVSCVSAGAAIAVMSLTGRAALARVHWDAARRGILKNLDVSRLLRGEKLAPHGPIYRSTIEFSLYEGGLERVRALPFPIWVLCAVPPRHLPLTLSTWLGLGAYSLEKKWNPRQLHPRAGAQLGFREFAFDARACETPQELADLLIASSSTPPFTPVGNFRRQPLLDGGICDNVPAALAERDPAVRKTLVLLTRPYPEGVTGEHGRRLYLEPSAPVPIGRWDYREGAPVEATLTLGRTDAERYAPRLEAWL
jgi:predicted acylesterase/phospholipase RssA